ncbi:MAG TPA: acetyl-CoA carboxylase biotin carboxyl carrier protein [Thermodesulfobacteriota bacterium]|nr:acetyl-CoA carboxylase biotin carboxyl carrier protein [Thermodesulfobacteriota bacterium]
MALEQDDVIRIIKILDESDFDELHLEMGDLKLDIAKSGTGAIASTRMATAPAPVVTRPAEAAPEAAPVPAVAPPKAPVQSVAEEGMVPIKSPLLGTFYRSPKPGAPPFVEVGSLVKPNDSVCLIEVMKTFTTLKAGMAGRIVKICAENAQMVEHQETLFLVEPE